MNWNKIAQQSADERRAMQNRKLKAFFQHQIRYSPYYRELLKKHDLSPADFCTTDDLVKLPFTTKEDLAPTAEDRARPRQFILQPDEALLKAYAPKSQLINLLLMKLTGKDPKPLLEWEYKPVHLHFTTGRTALPTAFAYTSRDLEMLKETGRRLLDVSGISPESVGINAFPFSPHLAFWLTYYAMTTIRMTSLSTGGGKIMGTEKILDSLERMKASVLTAIPGYGYHLLREAVRQKRDLSNMRYVLFGGERVSDGLRDKVKELLAACGSHDVRVLATYAMTESKTAWIQCSETSGYHLYPDMEFFELVNDEGRRVKDGERGQLVYTGFDWRGSVVVRYKTGDMALGIDEGACPYCGRTVPRAIADIQRSSDVKEFNLTKVKGELINLNNFYPTLSGMSEIEEWQVVLKKRNDDPFEVDEIELHIAPRAGVSFEQIRPAIEKRILNAVNVSVAIREQALPELLQRLGMETDLKEKRIVDLRKGG